MNSLKIFSLAKAIIAIVLFLLLSSQAVYASEETDPPRHILLLNSYHQSMTWVTDIVQAVEDELDAEQHNLLLHVENMDSKRFHSDDYIKSLHNFYLEKYRQTKFDLILSSDNNAFDFLRKYRDDLFPDVPVVFCGVNFFQDEQIAGLKDFTGVEEVFDSAATLEIALRNHPKTREVLIVNDFLKTGRAWEQSIRQQLEPFASRLKLRYADNLSLAELAEQVGELGPESIVLLGVYFSDRDGHYVTYERIGTMLARTSQVPVYCLLEFNIGEGVIGGNVISGHSQGQRMAAIGKEILHGKSAGQIPVVRTGTTQNIFDFSQLERFGIDETRLPQDHQILNRPFSFYQEYRAQIWLTVALISLLLLAILALLINIRRRQQAETQLRENEQKFRMIFDRSYGFIGLLKPDGTLLDVNRTAIEFCGEKIETLLNRPFWETAWWQHSADVQNQLRAEIQRAAAGKIVHFETTNRAADGSIHTFDVSITPLFDERGQVTQLIPEGTDISERKLMEQQLRESEERLSELIEQSPIGLALCAMDGSLVSVNSAYAKIIGHSVADALQLSFWDVTPEKYAPDEKRQLEQLEASGRYGPYEKEYRHKDGQLVPVRLNGMIVVRDGESLIWSSVEDISALKKAEIEKDGLTEQLRQSHKMEAIGTLAGGVAHDFNNILAAVLGYTQLTLRNPNCDAKIRKNLGNVLNAVERARELVKQILIFSRKDTLNLEPLQISRVVKEAVNLLRKTIPSTTKINLDVDDNTGSVLADETQIHQVVMNLCTNAHHAMLKQEGKIYISLKPVDIDNTIAERHPNLDHASYAQLSVTDCGKGMTPETMSHMFDPFFTTKGQGEGTGMGLAVVHGIVQNHAGAVHVESEEGKGTTFKVFFPLLDDAAPAADAKNHASATSAIKRGNEHILLVDDEPMLVELGKESLESFGYRVTATTSAKDALNFFLADPNGYDLIVTDQTMPEMTGVVLAKEAISVRPNVPVILCTGHSAVLNTEKAFALGVRSLLMKPLDINRLAEEVRKALDESA